MSIICITGPSHVDVQGVEKILHACGMDSHRPLERDASMNLLKWHERVLASLKSPSAKLKAVDAQTTSPSRMWEQLAVDLVVANMDSAHWGWAHAGAVDVLDFWAQLDSEIRFVLVCEEQTLFTCRLIEQGETAENIARHLAQWQVQHQSMLRFHLRHTDISRMVWASDVTAQPEPFIHHLNEAWQTPFKADLAQGQAWASPNLLLRQIASRVLAEHPQFAALAHELQAVLGPVQSIQFSSEAQTADLMNHYLQLTDRSLENKQLQQVRQEAQITQQTLQQELLSAQTHYEQGHREWLAQSEASKSANERALSLLSQTQEQLDKVVSEKQKVQSQYESELRAKQEALAALAKAEKAGIDAHQKLALESEAKLSAQTQIKDLQEESQLVLQQLHLVQEELEKHFLENQEFKKQIESESTVKQEALTKLAAEQKLSADFKKQRDAETLAKQEALTKLAAEQKHSADTQKQRDAEAAAKQDAQAKLTAEQKNSADLKKQRDAETLDKQDALAKLAAEQKLNADTKKQRDKEASEKQEALTKNKELQDEADLILKQLHQVQEELEKYYLQHQQSLQEVKKQQERWIRAVQKYPAMQEFEALELVAEKGVNDSLLWRVNQFNVNGQVRGPFQFRTVLENGIAGFVFAKGSQAESPLLRWPAIAAKDNELTIIPVKGQEEDSKKRTATILQLGTTDWQLIEQLNALIIQTVSSGTNILTKPQADALVAGLDAQKQIFAKVPPLLRFDSVKVLGQQNSANKHVLALQLGNADLQGERVSGLEFQLQLNSAASGPSAHLIFAENCANAPFTQWSDNVKNANGQPVMAMQINPEGWEPKLWHKLSAQDQQWLQSIVTVLPSMWVALQAQGTSVESGWPHWMEAATDLRNWSHQVVKPEVIKAVVAKVKLPKTAVSANPKTKAAVKPVKARVKALESSKASRQLVKPATKPVTKPIVKPATKTARRSK